MLVSKININSNYIFCYSNLTHNLINFNKFKNENKTINNNHLITNNKITNKNNKYLTTNVNNKKGDFTKISHESWIIAIPTIAVCLISAIIIGLKRHGEQPNNKTKRVCLEQNKEDGQYTETQETEMDSENNQALSSNNGTENVATESKDINNKQFLNGSEIIEIRNGENQIQKIDEPKNPELSSVDIIKACEPSMVQTTESEQNKIDDTPLSDYQNDLHHFTVPSDSITTREILKNNDTDLPNSASSANVSNNEVDISLSVSNNDEPEFDYFELLSNGYFSNIPSINPVTYTPENHITGVNSDLTSCSSLNNISTQKSLSGLSPTNTYNLPLEVEDSITSGWENLSRYFDDNWDYKNFIDDDSEYNVQPASHD